MIIRIIIIGVIVGVIGGLIEAYHDERRENAAAVCYEIANAARLGPDFINRCTGQLKL